MVSFDKGAVSDLCNPKIYTQSGLNFIIRHHKSKLMESQTSGDPKELKCAEK